MGTCDPLFMELCKARTLILEQQAAACCATYRCALDAACSQRPRPVAPRCRPRNCRHPRCATAPGPPGPCRYDLGLPPALLAACAVCRSGVKRAHLVDARLDGGLLLELYSRDGVGCMISTDFYEGIRRAGMQVGWRVGVCVGGWGWGWVG